MESGENYSRGQAACEAAAHVRLQFFEWALAVCHHPAIVELAITLACSNSFEDIFCWLTTNSKLNEEHDCRAKIQAVANTAFATAIDRGRLSCVRWLLDFGCKVNGGESDHGSDNPLLQAITKGNLKIVQLLVERGAKLTLKLEDVDVNAIQAASTLGHDSVAHWLFMRAVESGSIVDIDCHELLVSCAYLRTSSNFFAKAIVKQFPRLKDIGYRCLASKVTPLNSRLKKNDPSSHPRETVLDAAFKNGNVGFVCSLMTDPVFQGISMKTHLTPITLHQCLTGGNLNSVSLIVEYAEDVDTCIYNDLADEDGTLSPDNLSRLYLYSLVFDCFSSMCPDPTPENVLSYALNAAITHGSLRLVRWLLEEARIPIETDWIEGSPPYVALTNSRAEILDYLVQQHGVCIEDPRVKARGDGSVLHLAARICINPHMAKAFVHKLPHEVNTFDSEGRTPWMVASAKYSHKAVERVSAISSRNVFPEMERQESAPFEHREKGYSGFTHVGATDIGMEDREEHFLHLVKRMHRVFGKTLNTTFNVSVKTHLWRATEFMVENIFPEYSRAGPEHAHDPENLERIHSLFLRAADAEYPPLIMLLAQRFCLPEHIPKGLLYEHRYSWEGTSEEWQHMYYSSIVGAYLHRVPETIPRMAISYGPTGDEEDGYCEPQRPNKSTLPPPSIDPVLDACRTCDMTMLKTYIKFGAGLQRRSKHGATPLLVACAGWADHLPIVKWLLSKGCNLFEVDHFGRGVLDYAQPNGAIHLFLLDLIGSPPDPAPPHVH